MVKKAETKTKETKKVLVEKPKAVPIAGDALKTEIAKPADEISIIYLVNGLVEQAFRARASDIHIDPAEAKVDVRFRVDGVLHDAYVLPKAIQSEVTTRIKVLSGLRTDEHQAAQDGRFRIVADGVNVDVRVSITPTYYGENAVLRLLSTQAENYTLEGLGFTGLSLDRVRRNIRKPYGMILATGPTGSGKTTTLYTILKNLNTREVSIITIEDPVEYAIDGIEQIQVNPRTGLTFANGLRSILRQDPNIIMVGEIRDEETAGIAVNAALTGHLVLSTLHTNDAATTLPRLLDMGVEPFLIASTVNIAMAQRLLRKICTNCSVKKELIKEEVESLKTILPLKLQNQKLVFFHGQGCEQCDNTGYKGRIAIREILEMDDEIRVALMKRTDAGEIKKIAIKNGMTTMIESGIQQALDGQTTIEEVLRVIHE